MVLDNINKTSSDALGTPRSSPKNLDSPIFDPYTPKSIKGNSSSNSPVIGAGSASPSKQGKYAYNYFKQRGIPSHVAAGLVGNLQQESGVRALSYDDGANGPGGGGVAQWSPARYNGLKSFAATNKKDPRKIETQFDYILHELNTTESSAKKKIFATNNVDDATTAFQDYYFRPNKRLANTSNRVQSARGYVQYKYGGRTKYAIGGSNLDLSPEELAAKQARQTGIGNAVGAGLGMIGSYIDSTQTSTPNRKKTVGASALTGAGSGAALGTSILPGWGTAIGAVVGGVAGLIGGSAKAKKQQREFDKVQMQAQATFMDQQQNRSAMLYRQQNPYTFRAGGRAAYFQPQFEVEKGEIMRGEFAMTDGKKIAKNIYKVGGVTHDQINPKTGTTGVLAAGQGDIYSNSLSIGGKTPAQLALKIAGKIAKVEPKLGSKNVIERETAQRNMKLLNNDLDTIFNVQEGMKQFKYGGSTYTKFDKGGKTDEYTQRLLFLAERMNSTNDPAYKKQLQRAIDQYAAFTPEQKKNLDVNPRTTATTVVPKKQTVVKPRATTTTVKQVPTVGKALAAKLNGPGRPTTPIDVRRLTPGDPSNRRNDFTTLIPQDQRIEVPTIGRDKRKPPIIPMPPANNTMQADNTYVAKPERPILAPTVEGKEEFKPVTITEKRQPTKKIQVKPIKTTPPPTPKVQPRYVYRPNPYFDQQIRGDLQRTQPNFGNVETGPRPTTNQVGGLRTNPGVPTPVANNRRRFNISNDDMRNITSGLLIGSDYLRQQGAINRMETSYPVNLTMSNYYGYTDRSRLARHNTNALAGRLINNPNLTVGQKQQAAAMAANSINEINQAENQNRLQYDNAFADQQFRINASNNAILNQRNVESAANRNAQRQARADNFSNLVSNVNTLFAENQQRKLDQQRLDILSNAYRLKFGDDFVNDRVKYGN